MLHYSVDTVWRTSAIGVALVNRVANRPVHEASIIVEGKLYELSTLAWIKNILPSYISPLQRQMSPQIPLQ